MRLTLFSTEQRRSKLCFSNLSSNWPVEGGVPMSNCQLSQQRRPIKVLTFPSSSAGIPTQVSQGTCGHAGTPTSKSGNPFPLTAHLNPTLHGPRLPHSPWSTPKNVSLTPAHSNPTNVGYKTITSTVPDLPTLPTLPASSRKHTTPFLC